MRTKKKIRRTSDMIEKNFMCPFPKCGKYYGTDVSLNLHMKIKHQSGTKT
jgi:transcription elongation factor Elf1